ncbi:MAG: ATP-binding protein [Trebonia sp.]
MHAGNRALNVNARTSVVTAADAEGDPAPRADRFPDDPAGEDGGGTAGAAWKLPDGPTCAKRARTHVRQALSVLRLPESLISDAELAVSELAANAWQHALDGKSLPEEAGSGTALPELWLYRRGASPGAELVCGVFDTRRDVWPEPQEDSLRLVPCGDDVADPLLDALLTDAPGNGRGLGIVEAVSHDTGCHRTRSRLNSLAVPGKVTWFTMKIPASSPAAQPPPANLTPFQAAHALSTLLTWRGIPGISHDHGTRTQSVVSIAAGLSVRCRDGIFQWLSGGPRQRAFFDLADTLEDLIRLHEDMAYAGQQTSG